MIVTAIEPSGNLYGSEHCLLDIIRGTTPRGIEWEVLTTAGGGFDRLLANEGIRRHTILPRDSHKLKLWKKLPGYLRMRRALRSAAPHVVYLNQAGMLRATLAALRGTSTPLVCQVQTLEDAALMATTPEYHQRVTSFICNSRFIAGQAALPRNKTSIFYQPVMQAVASATARAPTDGPWRIGIVGRIAKGKGHWVFLEAAKLFVASAVHPVQFVVVGDGLDTETTEGYREAVNSAGMAALFDLRGYRTNILDELARLHIVAIPSLAEPLGRVLLDACVAGRPTTVSSSGGLGEFSQHFDLGRRVPPADARALAHAWLQMMADYDVEQRVFERASAAALMRLKPATYLEGICELLAAARDGKSSRIEWLGDAA